MQYPETRYARGNDGNVAYQVIGEGPRDLVFVMHWVSNIDVMWDQPSLARFLRRLATFSRLLCFDKRGTGVSDTIPLAALPTFEQWSDDVQTVMQAAGSKRATLVVHGDAGWMAMLYAATHPEQVSGLILVNSCARRLRDVDYPWGLPSGQVAPALEAAETQWGSGGHLHVLAPSVAHDESFRRWFGRYQRVTMGPRAARAIIAAEFEMDLRSILPAIRVPTLVLHRTGDRYIRVGLGRYLAAHIPGAKFVELAGEDHLFYAGDTEAMLGEIEEFVTGVRSMPEIDRVLATVLFTDIVDGTATAARLGDRAWRELLMNHNSLVRQELERFRGLEIDTAGDGFLASFDGPARAARCACAIVERVNSLGIAVRAGLHTGECELMSDGKLGGIAVHIGARVAALARAGEVLVSSTVRDLVAGSGLAFEDRGLRSLKGVPEQWHLFAIAR